MSKKTTRFADLVQVVSAWTYPVTVNVSQVNILEDMGNQTCKLHLIGGKVLVIKGPYAEVRAALNPKPPSGAVGLAVRSSDAGEQTD